MSWSVPADDDEPEPVNPFAPTSPTFPVVEPQVVQPLAVEPELIIPTDPPSTIASPEPASVIPAPDPPSVAAAPDPPSVKAEPEPPPVTPTSAEAAPRSISPVRRLRSLISGGSQSVTPHSGEKTNDVILVDRVVKTYAIGDIKVHALRKISLNIERGDFVAIMGASGSGKSTLMNIIGCLDLPTHGRYLLDGVDVRGMTEDELSDVRNRKIGFVFQSFNLIPRTEAIVNVELPLIYAGVRRGERRKRAERALTEVGLAERLHHMPNELSGGQQQRVAVARAIATNPAIILADEPTGNLDTKATHEVLDIFSRLNAAGRTVVLITHEDDVAAYCKRIIRLVDGHIVDDHRVAPVDGPPPRHHKLNAVERATHEAERSKV
jgi:putative ABC transport system ATP-binding protein